MSRLGDTIADAVGEIVDEKISDKIEGMFDKLEATLDEKVDEKVSDTVDSIDKLETRIEALEESRDEMPDARDVRKVSKFLDNHNYEDVCNEVDGNTKLLEELTERLEKLEEAGTFNEGHKQIIVDVVEERLASMIKDNLIQAGGKTDAIHPTDAIHIVALLREIRDLLKAKG